MRKKILFMFLLSIALLPVRVYAYTCSYIEQANLRKLASNVTAIYDYEEYSDNVSFNVTLTNINSNIYILDTTNGFRYDYNGGNEITIKGYKPDQNIQYKIYPVQNDCLEDYLFTKYVNLPGFNKYYKDPLCNNNNNPICYKWKTNNLTYDEFVKMVSKKDEETKEEDNKNVEITLFDKIFEFIMTYYLYMIIGIMIFILPISYLINRKKNSFDL